MIQKPVLPKVLYCANKGYLSVTSSLPHLHLAQTQQGRQVSTATINTLLAVCVSPNSGALVCMWHWLRPALSPFLVSLLLVIEHQPLNQTIYSYHYRS
jgi:hypothetical protein